MQRNRIFKKVISVICALAMLLTAVYQPGWAMRSEAASEVDITTSTTMGNAHTGWFDGCWTVFIDPGDYTIASEVLADGTSSYFYINNHESVNNVDMAEYILVNGVSVREHINNYTGSLGSAFPMSAGAVYNPILVDTFQPYDNIRVSVLSGYIAMADLKEVTLKAGFSWANTDGQTLKVTKDVTYTYATDGTATRKAVDITTSTTMGEAHPGWFAGCWTVFIDPGDYTIASAELADGTSSYFYINNHEGVNNVDMAEYILINGVSVRDHINSYTGSWGSASPMSAGAVYNPILVDTFQPYDNIRVSVLSDYIAMADLKEVTLKAGFSWANTNGETLKVTKDVTYTYAADGTATRKAEEIKKIGWQDFGVTAETTYKDEMTALSYDGTTLDNTEFEGDVTFSACSELRYGGLNDDQGLQLSVDNSGRFRILENTYTVEPIGDWSWPENSWNERVFTPADLGITEYDSFIGKRITLKIKMEEVTETTAKVTIHINDKIVGGAFRMTSKDANTFKTGTVVGICCNGYGAFNPITVEPIVTNISWNDFAGVTYGVPYTTNASFEYSEASLQYTELTGRAMFAAGGVLRIGGDAGLHIGADRAGKLYVNSHTFTQNDYETGKDWTYDAEPETYGIDTFVNTPVDLKVRIGKISEDKKTVEKVELYINGVQVGNAFSMTSGAWTIGSKFSLCYDDDRQGAGAVTILSDEAVPGEFISVTWEDFGITGSYVYNKSSSARTAHHFENLNNTLFNGDVKMAAGAHFRYGCDSKAWSGLQFTVNENGSLTINSATFNWGTQGDFAATQFGMESFVNTRFNLKIAMTDVTTTSAKVGVWINNQMAGTYFTMTSTDAEVYKLGTTILWATTASDIVPYSVGKTYDADSLTPIRLTDWPTGSGKELGTELTHYEINGSSNNKVDSLVGTSFCETIKFVGPTPNTNDAYMFCYGGEKGTDKSWHGLRIALVGDQMVLYSGVSSFTEYWYLDAHTAGIAAFTNTEYQLRIDVVRLGQHALVYMYFDGVLYNNAPFVLEDFADKMSNTLVFRAEVTDATPYAILGASEKNLFDLYHDLGVKEGETSGYVLPTGLTSAKKVEGSNEKALSVSGGNTISEAGIYQIEFNDGVSKYSQKVYLYQAGDINQNDKWDAIDLVKVKKHIYYNLEPSGIDAKTKDANKDGIVNDDDVSAIRKRIVGSYQADSSEVMPVVGFYGPIDNSDGTEGTVSMNTVKKEVYDMIEDLGINTIVQYQNQYTDVASDRYEVYQQLTLAQNIGVKMTVQDYRLNSKANTATAEDVKNAIANYKNYQSFAGLYITDEPRSDSYPPNNNSTNTISHFSNLAKAVKQAGVWAYSNAKAYMYKEVKNQTASYQYKNYLTDYMDAFELDFLSSTYYPFFTYEIHNGGVGNGVEDAAQYFENLALVSAVANEKNVPFWRVIQSGDGFEMSDREDGNPSEGEFKWNVNTSLAFGAKGITYFQLVQDKTSYEVSNKDATTSGLIGATGKKNEWYDYAKEANAQIQAVDDVLMNATYQGFMANGTKATNATASINALKLYKSSILWAQPETTVSMNKSSSYGGATVTSEDASYGAVTGCFKTKDNKNAMYVVNYNVTTNNTVTVNFGSQKTVTYVQNAVTKTEDVQTLQLNLAAGDAALIIFG